MKTTISTWVITLLSIATCGGCIQTNTQEDELITVDVTASYPKKELILQDFMDVEYIPLESSNEFVTMGWLHAIGKDIMVIRNRNRNTDGDIFIFDRNGKALRKINRLGQGNEEYQFLLAITLDEENNEIFVNDHWMRKIFVYDLFGKFKRSFEHKQGWYGMDIYNFDRNNLICCTNGLDSNDENLNTYVIISKQNGSITKEIEIPYDKKVSSLVYSADSSHVMPIRNRTLIPHRGNSLMLMENSSDTIYKLSSDYSMTPLIVRTPLIGSMSPGIFLYPAVLTDQYCFMQTVKAEWNWQANTGHKRTDLMYDKQEKAIFEYVIYNADYDNEQPVCLTSEIPFGNNEIAVVLKLEAVELVEAYKKGQLKGKLKEIAATLDEESNPVLMLVKYKK